jgi:hypothetical protein
MIKPITCERFHQLFKFPRCDRYSPAAMLRSRTKETQWFANEDETQLGVIIYETVDKDWQTIVLNKREDWRTFRAWDVVASLPSEHAALIKLKELMNRGDSPGIWESWSSSPASGTE